MPDPTFSSRPSPLYHASDPISGRRVAAAFVLGAAADGAEFRSYRHLHGSRGTCFQIIDFYKGNHSNTPRKLLHGFDDTGRLYSPSGQKRDWWPPETSDQFRERTKCFVRQYTQEIFVGGTVDGRMTLSENIADNGGLVAAYQVGEERFKLVFL